MVDSIKNLYGQPTNTAQMMQDTANQEALSQVYAQMQGGLDQISQEDLRESIAQKKSLNRLGGGQRGLNLAHGKYRGLNMSFEKSQVEGLTELQVPFDESEVPLKRAPIGSHRGRSLNVSFNKR